MPRCLAGNSRSSLSRFHRKYNRYDELCLRNSTLAASAFYKYTQPRPTSIGALLYTLTARHIQAEGCKAIWEILFYRRFGISRYVSHKMHSRTNISREYSRKLRNRRAGKIANLRAAIFKNICFSHFCLFDASRCQANWQFFCTVSCFRGNNENCGVYGLLFGEIAKMLWLCGKRAQRIRSRSIASSESLGETVAEAIAEV